MKFSVARSEDCMVHVRRSCFLTAPNEASASWSPPLTKVRVVFPRVAVPLRSTFPAFDLLRALTPVLRSLRGSLRRGLTLQEFRVTYSFFVWFAAATLAPPSAKECYQ